MGKEIETEPEYPLEELASLPSFYHPMVSPNGDRIALYYDGSGRNELCLFDPHSGELEQLSEGEVPRTARWWIGWDASAEQVFYHVDEGGNEQNDIHGISTAGTVNRLVEDDGQSILLEPSPDGDALLYLNDSVDQLNLWEYSFETGERTQLTSYDQPVRGGLLDPSGDRIAYITNESDDLDNLDVYLAAADGSNPRRLEIGEHGAEAGVVDWHSNGDRLLVEDNSANKDRVGIYSIEDDEVTWLSDGTAVESATAFSPDGSLVLGTRSRDASRVPIVYDVETGQSRELALPEGVASFAGRSYYGGSRSGTFLADGRPVLTLSAPSERSRLLAYDLEAGEYEVLLDADYGSIDPASFVGAEYVTYESTDGEEIGAVLWDARQRPSADADSTDQPALVIVHGGPHSQTVRGFNEYVQFFVSQGYSVLGPNYRGSIGRGREFQNAIREDWGGMEAEDIREAGRWLKNQPWIDEDRVVVFGGSYGGYSTYVQLTRFPGEWAAGMAWIGITDLQGMYEESMPHFKSFIEQQMGDPEENAELYRARSPLTHVDNVEDPILIVHGVNDPRCPIGQARSFREGLEARDWVVDEDFAYEELGEEGHGSTDTEQKIRAYRIMADFLDEWV